MKHDWYLDPDSSPREDEVDIFRLDAGCHNGPQCKRCRMAFCHHCQPECYTEECPAGDEDE